MGSPGPPGAPPIMQNNHQSSQGSPISVLADQPNSSVGSAPSSSDSSSSDERRLPQPIGAGRAARKLANHTNSAEGASQHSWGFPSDIDSPALWRGTAVVTSVITTTVVTSTTILPGSGLIDGNDRPSSVPPIVSPHLLAGGYASEPMSESQ